MTEAATIAELHAAYRTGATAEAEIARVFAAIARVDDRGIFISLRPEADVRAEARALAPFDPDRYPLWGVPFAVKDNIDVVGLPTTCACPAFSYAPGSHATAVERLIAAGALVIGKTNLDQFATGLVGVRSPYPIPRNAIDPALVPGGSSSGSAVAVAHGIVPFALGTDTAGSGRVPAGLNGIVGLKPSVGAVSSRGMVPACRTLDCISVFAGTVDDAWRVYATMAAYDAEDPYARPIVLGVPGRLPPALTLGVPRAADLKFFGDRSAERAFAEARAVLAGLGARFVEIDMTAFYETAALLYEGAWVAERHVALRPVLEGDASVLHPVTRRIVEGATRFSASDLFAAIYRLAALKRATESVWSAIDMLVVPTTPHAPTREDLAADPIRPNAELGTYTNFVNLLDLAAIAVPGPRRDDGRTAGITLIGPRGTDARLASVGRAAQIAAGQPIGATGRSLPPLPDAEASAPDGSIELAVVGAHLSGMPLNGELKAAGGVFLRAVKSEPVYRLYALPGGPPHRPALVRVAEGGAAIETEVWALPAAGFGRFVAGIPAPLGIGTLRLADGSCPKGFVAESIGVLGAEDISVYGGWRAFAAARLAQAP